MHPNLLEDLLEDLPEGETRAREVGAKLFPEDWSPSAVDREFAKSHGHADGRIDREAQLCREWHRAHGAAVADVAAAFRLWILRVPSFERPDSGARSSSGTTSPAQSGDWAIKLRKFRANGFWNALSSGPPPGDPGCTVPSEFLTAAEAAAKRGRSKTTTNDLTINLGTPDEARGRGVS